MRVLGFHPQEFCMKEEVSNQQEGKPRLRGFAAMSPEKKKEIAGMGGRAAHASGRAHQFSTEEARAAGKKRHQVAASQPDSGNKPAE
jgi:general stress protein YciG